AEPARGRCHRRGREDRLRRAHDLKSRRHSPNTQSRQEDASMKICMLGSGALGSALGGVLTEGGNDVWLIDAWAGHIDAMNSRGLTLRDGGVDRTVKVKASTSPDGIGPADLIVVLVKSFHTREAIEKAGAIIGPDTAIMSLQNGL